MTLKSIQADVEKAVVTITRNNGRGVFINDNLVITAAHCIRFECNGAMALGDRFIEEIKTAEGKLVKLEPFAVEPVSDIAILGPLDDEDYLEEVENFEMFCEETKPVSMCRSEFEVGKEVPIYIYSKERTWVTGTATQCRKDAETLWLQADQPISGGASGGPVINESGELVSIVSAFSEDCLNGSKYYGRNPFPQLALPVWVYRRVFGQKD